MLGTSDAWLMSCLAHRPNDPAYYIEDCRILRMLYQKLIHPILYLYRVVETKRNMTPN